MINNVVLLNHSISAESSPNPVPIVLTLVTVNGGNEVLLKEVAQEFKKIQHELEIQIIVQNVDRFGEENNYYARIIFIIRFHNNTICINVIIMIL